MASLFIPKCNSFTDVELCFQLYEIHNSSKCTKKILLHFLALCENVPSEAVPSVSSSPICLPPESVNTTPVSVILHPPASPLFYNTASTSSSTTCLTIPVSQTPPSPSTIPLLLEPVITQRDMPIFAASQQVTVISLYWLCKKERWICQLFCLSGYNKIFRISPYLKNNPFLLITVNFQVVQQSFAIFSPLFIS